MDKPIAFKAFFVSCLFIVVVAFLIGAKQQSVYIKAERTTHSIEVNDALHCSATSIGEYAILTAAHCFPTDEAVEFTIDGREAKARKFARDGNDHVLILVDIAFEHKATFSKVKAVKGDTVFYYGNPSLRQLFRIGRVAGFKNKEIILDINGWHGDSGAAIFNEQGKVISVVSEGYIHDIFKLVVIYPLEFTTAQYESFGVVR